LTTIGVRKATILIGMISEIEMKNDKIEKTTLEKALEGLIRKDKSRAELM
jgi:hypothetical protein